MPGALVPANRSSQFEPSTKPIALGGAQHLRVAADPEQLGAGVGDRHDRVAVAGGLAEHVVEQREDLGQRVRLAVVTQRVVGQRDRRLGVVGAHPGRGRAVPGLRDLRAHAPVTDHLVSAP